MATTQEVWRIIIKKTHRHTHSFINPLRENRTHPSGCCSVFLMVLICWKWQDISVLMTISITSVRSSLWESQHSGSSELKTRTDPPSAERDIVSQRWVSNPSVPPVIFWEVDQDVHLIFLHESVGCAHMVVFQNRAIVVQDGHFWSVQEQRKRSQKMYYLFQLLWHLYAIAVTF